MTSDITSFINHTAFANQQIISNNNVLLNRSMFSIKRVGRKHILMYENPH